MTMGGLGSCDDVRASNCGPDGSPLGLLDAAKGLLPWITASGYKRLFDEKGFPELQAAIAATEKRYAACNHEKAVVRWSGIKCSYCPDCGWPLEVKE